MQSSDLLESQEHQQLQQNRRTFLSKSLFSGAIAATATMTTPSLTLAADDGEDMTSQMYNADGSLIDMSKIEIEAKSNTVTVMFPSKESSIADAKTAFVSADGNAATNQEGQSLKSNSSAASAIKSTYEVPDKWTPAPEYLDTLLSVREKACDHITVYQVPGTFKDNSVLEKATTIGLAKALNFASTGPGVFPKKLAAADIVSGRKVNKAASSAEGEELKRKYFEFDLAVAPDTCGQSAENLNLGFCPYDTIVLLSATIVDNKMMVCGVECTKNEWKRANADLKRIRGSFFVEENESSTSDEAISV